MLACRQNQFPVYPDTYNLRVYFYPATPFWEQSKHTFNKSIRIHPYQKAPCTSCSTQPNYCCLDTYRTAPGAVPMIPTCEQAKHNYLLLTTGTSHSHQISFTNRTNSLTLLPWYYQLHSVPLKPKITIAVQILTFRINSYPVSSYIHICPDLYQ